MNKYILPIILIFVLGANGYFIKILFEIKSDIKDNHKELLVLEKDSLRTEIKLGQVLTHVDAIGAQIDVIISDIDKIKKNTEKSKLLY